MGITNGSSNSNGTASGGGGGDGTGTASNGGSAGRRILIIGGGVAGLTLALALKRAARSTGLQLIPVIFDECPPEAYSEAGPHYVLWRWAVEVLLEMGIGGRLSKIASPLLYFTSRETETDEVIVQWPPADRTKDPIDAEIGLDSAIPPMVATRRCDLLRLLMLAISGAREDLVYGDDYLPTSANNSDLVPDHIDDLDADLAQGRWFENEGFADLLPELNLGEKLESFSFDSSTGDVVAEFASGRVERGFMLVGADGANSTTRKLLYQDGGPSRIFPLLSSPARHNLSHAGACVIHGITRLHVPPVDTPDSLENGTPIPDLLRDDVHEYCPDGRANAIVGKGMSFSVTHLGNGMLGWSLLAAQSEPNKHAGDFTMQKTRRLLSESIAKNPRQKDKWGSRDLPARYSPEPNDDGDEDDDLTMPPMAKNASPPPNPATLRGVAAVNLSDPSLQEKLSGLRDSPTSPTGNPRNPKRVSMPLEPLPFNPVAAPSSVPNLFGPQEPLSGAEVRTLALRLSQNFPLPHPCHAIMARTDPKLTAIVDLHDLADDPLDTLSLPIPVTSTVASVAAAATSPVTTLFGDPFDVSGGGSSGGNGSYSDLKMNHVGRIMLIGDAAHPLAVTASGGLGANLALTDAVLLAKLLAKYLASPATPPAESLRRMAGEMDKERCALAASAMKEARAEGGWDRSESAIVRGLMRLGRYYTPTGWTRSSYAQMLTRGAVKSGLPSLMPVKM
ncbi:hypothetical protein DFJ73DRAFT_899758 [Zopfochytrium polystomum]|nr:hypothetical protein DFJ73DRAFT_899758 [Zopfochytrium polystomum]